MLNGFLRCVVNWFVEIRSITYAVLSNGISVPFFNYTTMEQP
ncbi:RAxF-45 family protein [Fictibacillus gelatini]|nr:RAxF-45 family protein [Fictibacillus gelatini]